MPLCVMIWIISPRPHPQCLEFLTLLPINVILFGSRVLEDIIRLRSYGKESTCQSRRCKRYRFDPQVRKIPWSKKWQATPVFLPIDSMDRGAWWTIVYRVAKSWAWLSEHTCRQFNMSGILLKLREKHHAKTQTHRAMLCDNRGRE